MISKGVDSYNNPFIDLPKCLARIAMYRYQGNSFLINLIMDNHFQRVLSFYMPVCWCRFLEINISWH